MLLTSSAPSGYNITFSVFLKATNFLCINKNGNGRVVTCCAAIGIKRENRPLCLQDPKLFFSHYNTPLIIDEIQYAPQLFSLIKITIDKDRSNRGQFILIGSQSFSLMSGVTESLAGRIAVLTLLPFSIKERLPLIRSFSLSSLKAELLSGGFPEISINKKLDLNLWFAGYLQTYLERDLRQLRNVGDLTDFQRFLKLLAANNGQILRLSEMSRDLGVAVNTVKAWISVLEASNQIVLIKPFYKNKGKRIIKSPKLYFLDTGFLCYMLGIRQSEQVFKGPGSGQLFETVVLGEILRNFYCKGEIPRVFWWRTSSGEEVDFIVEKGNKIFPIEVKLSANVSKRLAKGLFSFNELFGGEVGQSFLVNLSDKVMPIGDKVLSYPFLEFAASASWI